MKVSEREPQLRLEFASHANEQRDYDEIQEKYDSGNPASSIWPGVVDKRLDDYDPGILVMDSLSPILGERYDYPELTEDIKEAVWQGTPTGALTNRESVLVGAGDSVLLFSQAWYRESFVRGMADLFGEAAVYGAVGATAGAAIGGLSKLQERSACIAPNGPPVDPLLAKDWTEPPDSNTLPSTMGRRRFLRTGLNVGIAAGFLASYSGFIPSNLPTHALDPLYHANRFSSAFLRMGLGNPRYQEADGRTALLIEKGLFMRDLLGEDTAAIMGNFHAHNSHHYLHNPEGRRRAIARLAESYGASITSPMRKLGGELDERQPSAEQKLESIKTEIGSIALFEVRRPYAPGTPKSDWNRTALQNAVSYLETFEVPACQQVLEVSGLA